MEPSLKSPAGIGRVIDGGQIPALQSVSSRRQGAGTGGGACLHAANIFHAGVKLPPLEP